MIPPDNLEIEIRWESQFLDSTCKMTKVVNIMNATDREYLNFVDEVRKAFAFLSDLGFSEIEALPTLVRYRKSNVEVDVYHGRHSHEIGVGVTVFGTRFAISEIIRANDPEIEKHFRYPMTTTPEGVAIGLQELSKLMKRYGLAALDGDPQYFSILEKQREMWSKEYALEVLARQLRPQADAAFRQKDYSKAAKLYSQFRDCLSPAEIKKLSIAGERCKD